MNWAIAWAFLEGMRFERWAKQELLTEHEEAFLREFCGRLVILTTGERLPDVREL